MAPVNDDLRLTVEFADEDAAREFVRWLHEARLDAGDRQRVGDRVIVSRDDEVVYLYAADEEQAREVARLIEARVGHPAAARIRLDRWHPVEQRWEDAAVPLPTTDEELQAERARFQAREAAESRASGRAEWEVRVELPDRETTDDFADRLESERLPVVRRSTFVLVGAAQRGRGARAREASRGGGARGRARRGRAGRPDGLGGRPDQPLRRLRRPRPLGVRPVGPEPGPGEERDRAGGDRSGRESRARGERDPVA